MELIAAARSDEWDSEPYEERAADGPLATVS